MHFPIIAALGLFSLASANDKPKYELHINTPALFGSHTAGYIVEAGNDYYRCSFYGTGDCSKAEKSYILNAPGSGTPKKLVHEKKGGSKGKSFRCVALGEDDEDDE
ncbi:hypothetical protein N7478_002739 [Penicillium angulare]|uniref:uncharacterized protein n=1 Tax=Penicillium angulare TaxID=116970 RepID=UPI0025416225|nr:uncharacterized protein N7478_002739 [Penicillium angulare]KAJ5287053.1 hypothetical protein N7478_002739 [Penicillium angulare]